MKYKRYFHHHWQCLSGLTIVMVTTITILTTAILRSCTATSPVFLLRIRISVCFNFSYFSLIIFTTIIITTYNCSVCHRLAVASETNICDKKLLRFWNDWEGNSVTSTLKYTCIVLHWSVHYIAKESIHCTALHCIDKYWLHNIRNFGSGVEITNNHHQHLLGDHHHTNII